MSAEAGELIVGPRTRETSGSGKQRQGLLPQYNPLGVDRSRAPSRASAPHGYGVSQSRMTASPLNLEMQGRAAQTIRDPVRFGSKVHITARRMHAQ
jgi:hypothetical protein